MTVYAAVLSGGMEIDRISGTPETVPGSVRPGVLFVQEILPVNEMAAESRSFQLPHIPGRCGALLGEMF